MSDDYMDSYEDAAGNQLHLAHGGLSYQLWSVEYGQWMGYDSSTPSVFPDGPFSTAKDAYDVWFREQAPRTPEVQAFMDGCEQAADAAVAVGTAVIAGALTVDAAAHVVELVAELVAPLAYLTGIGLAVDLAVIKAAISTEHVAEAIMKEATTITWDGVALASLRYDAQVANAIPVNAQSVLARVHGEVQELASTWQTIVTNLASAI